MNDSHLAFLTRWFFNGYVNGCCVNANVFIDLSDFVIWIGESVVGKYSLAADIEIQAKEIVETSVDQNFLQKVQNRSHDTGETGEVFRMGF